MVTLRAILHEIIGLFVDDGSLALALVAWCTLIGLLLLLLPGSALPALALLGGCVAILLANIRATARRLRRG